MKVCATVYTLKGKGAGYAVMVEDDNGTVIEEYTASNNPYNVAHGLPVDHPAAIPLEKLREYAEATAAEMAEEYGAHYVGLEVVPLEEVVAGFPW